jgi:hypothetical protein
MMSWGAALRLALKGGRSDRARMVLTAVGSALGAFGVLSAISVVRIRSGDGPYGRELLDQPGLRPGVIVTLLALCVPLVVFVGQCTRVGAPVRDRRLSALRMAGATPADVVRIAALETGLVAAGGATLAGGGFFVVRRLFAERARSLPLDVSMPGWTYVVVAAVCGTAAAVASVVTLRRVALTPFKVARLEDTRPARAVPAVLVLVSAAGLGLFSAVLGLLNIDELTPIALLAFGLFVAGAIGLISGAASVASAVGGWLAQRTRRPALLIAGRRMNAAPYTASRATTAVVVAVLLGAAIQGVRATFLTSTDPSDTFYAETFDLLNLALLIGVVLASASLLVVASESIVARRRTLAALQAAGTPRSVLGRAVLVETLVPLVVSVVAAAVIGVFAARGMFGTTVTSSGSTGSQLVGVPVPWAAVGVLIGGAIAAATAITALSLVFLRSSADPSELRAAA